MIECNQYLLNLILVFVKLLTDTFGESISGKRYQPQTSAYGTALCFCRL